MPLWRIYHPKGLYTDAEKADFSAAITKLYAILPEFYVVVIFEEVASSNYFVGGKPRGDFVRICVEQIARTFDPADVERKKKWMARIEETVAPWTSNKAGVDGSEYNIVESSRDLWLMNGLVPPLPGEDGEEVWKKAGKPVAY